MKSLFGDEIPDAPPRRRACRRDYARPYVAGTGPSDMACRDCAYYVRLPYHGKVYFKCGKMIEYWTHGSKTDIRLKDPACRSFKQDSGDTDHLNTEKITKDESEASDE